MLKTHHKVIHQMPTNLAKATERYGSRPTFAKPNESRLAETNRTDEAMGSARTSKLRANVVTSLYPNVDLRELTKDQMLQTASATLLTKRLMNDITIRNTPDDQATNSLIISVNQALNFYERLIQPRLNQDPQMKSAHQQACDDKGVDPNSPAGIALALQTAGSSIANDYDAQVATLAESIRTEEAERTAMMATEAGDAERALEDAENTEHTVRPEPRTRGDDDEEQHYRDESNTDNIEKSLEATEKLDELSATMKENFNAVDDTLKQMESHLEHGAVHGAVKIAEKGLEFMAKEAIPALSRGNH